MPTSGVLLFIHENCGEEVKKTLVDFLNRHGRVSDEVLSVHWVKPTRGAVGDLCLDLRTDNKLLGKVELLHKLRANNALRDLTASWRLQSDIVSNFKLLVGFETINPLYRHKYPIPNLTLQAGSIEEGESAQRGALREVLEEVKVEVDPCMLKQKPIGLLRGGMLMYPCYIFDKRNIVFDIEKDLVRIKPIGKGSF